MMMYTQDTVDIAFLTFWQPVTIYIYYIWSVLALLAHSFYTCMKLWINLLK